MMMGASTPILLITRLFFERERERERERRGDGDGDGTHVMEQIKQIPRRFRR